MAGNRLSIDRRLIIPSITAASAATEGIVVFRDGWGDVTRRYDLTKLALPKDVTFILADAFQQRYVPATLDTRRACWQALQSFARFVREDTGIQSAHDVCTGAIGRYIAWLNRQTTQTGEYRSFTGRANQVSYLRQLVNWTKRHHPSRLPQRIDFPYRAYPNRNAQPRRRLPADQLKAILRACYEDIDAGWERFEQGRQILQSDTVPAGISPELYGLVRDLAGIDGGVMPTRLTLVARRFNMSALSRHGGLRTLAGYLHLTSEMLIPFYIALAIQTAANPQPLLQLRRNCLRPHPFDEHREIIDWDKPRAGDQLKRLQRRSFDRRRRYAAPNLVDKLLAMTTVLAEQAVHGDRDCLFLVMSEKTRRVTPLSPSTLTHTLKGFIANANERIDIWNRAAPERLRTRLPDFAAVLLRGSVATEHYQASGGDIVHVQQILNHSSAATTEVYVKGPRTEQLRRDMVARLQRLMLSWIGGTTDPSTAHNDGVRSGSVRATAAFGHDCLNPLAGVAPGAQAGEACPYLGGCLRCPGLVIPIDVPHLARIFRAKEGFERAREQLDPQRWELLYASSYRILVQDILPDFPVALHAPAAAMAADLPGLPALE